MGETRLFGTVVYLLASPLSNRDYTRFGIDVWIQRGWEVKVFDCTKFLRPRLFEYVDGETSSVDFEGLYIFDDAATVLRSIDRLSGLCLFVDVLTDSKPAAQIRRLARKTGKVARCYLGSLPYLPVNRRTFIDKLLKATRNPKKFAERLIQVVNAVLIRDDYAVVAGNKTLNDCKQLSWKKICAHNFDYDFVILDKEESRSHCKGYALFLDSDEAYHSDYAALGKRPHVSPAEYFKTMDRGLELIGKSLGKNIVVAAHPRSSYSKRPLKFSFPIIEDASYQLVKNADTVISHGSTALQWAILRFIPILLVTTDELHRSPFAGHTKGFAHELGKNIINLNAVNEEFDWAQCLSIDKKLYMEYIEKYVKIPGSPERPVWEIVIDRVERDFKA